MGRKKIIKNPITINDYITLCKKGFSVIYRNGRVLAVFPKKKNR